MPSSSCHRPLSECLAVDPREWEAGKAQATQVSVCLHEMIFRKVRWVLSSRGWPFFCFNSTQGLKKSNPLDSKTLPGRTSSSWGGGGIGNGAHLRGHHPGHPFIQDPAMPPLPPPNTLAQLEEACRRLEEVSKPPKQRYKTVVHLICYNTTLYKWSPVSFLIEYWFVINLVIFTDIRLEPATFRETGTTRQLSSPREATL